MSDMQVTYLIDRELSGALRAAPRKVALYYFAIAIPVFFYTGYQMFAYQGVGPYGANRLWMVAGLIVIAISTKFLRRIFQHRDTIKICEEITSMLDESENFQKALYKILIMTPWSKCQVAIGRPRNMQMRQIPIIVKGRSNAVMNIAKDLSGIEISMNPYLK